MFLSLILAQARAGRAGGRELPWAHPPPSAAEHGCWTSVQHAPSAAVVLSLLLDLLTETTADAPGAGTMPIFRTPVTCSNSRPRGRSGWAAAAVAIAGTVFASDAEQQQQLLPRQAKCLLHTMAPKQTTAFRRGAHIHPQPSPGPPPHHPSLAARPPYPRWAPPTLNGRMPAELAALSDTQGPGLPASTTALAVEHHCGCQLGVVPTEVT